jgi:hypothetical protein
LRAATDKQRMSEGEIAAELHKLQELRDEVGMVK